jgi:ADP-ribosylglycohydrolase
MAIGDAYGAGMEYTQPEFVRKHNRLEGYIQHPKWKGLKPGQYTDDTQMALALAELMLSSTMTDEPVRPDKWTAFFVAQAFMEVFNRDPREGYAQGFYKVLTGIAKRHPDDPVARAFRFLSDVYPHSQKNGGAMRAGPIGLLPKTQDVIDRAMFQASLTHATQEGMTAAAASALMVHYFHYGYGPAEDLPFYLDDLVPLSDADLSWADPWEGRVLAPGTQAVRAALTAIVPCDNLADILKACVAFGGDTDTVAAIAMCAASRSKDIARNLPAVLVRKLEDGKYGRDYLIGLDDKLLARFPSPVFGPGKTIVDLVDSILD